MVVDTLRPIAGVEIAGDHDPDRLDPTRDVEDRPQPALGEHVVVGRVASRFTARRGRALLDPEVLESLVVLLESSGHRCEVVAPRPLHARRAWCIAASLAATATATAAPTACITIALLPRRPGGARPFPVAGGRSFSAPTAAAAGAGDAAAVIAVTAVGRPRVVGGPRPVGGPGANPVAGGQWLVVRIGRSRGRDTGRAGGIPLRRTLPARSAPATAPSPAPARAPPRLAVAIAAFGRRAISRFTCADGRIIAVVGIDVGELALVPRVGQAPVVGTGPWLARPRRRPRRREAIVITAWFARRNATLAAGGRVAWTTGTVPPVDPVGARSSGVAGLVVVCRRHVAARRLAGHGGAIVAPAPAATAPTTAATASPAAAAVAFVSLR